MYPKDGNTTQEGDMRKEDILDEQHWKFKDYRQRITTKQWKELLLTDDDRVIFQGRVCPLSGKNLGSGVVEDKMEYTVNGKTYRQLKEITVKALIKLDAPDADIESLLEDYGFTEPISLRYALNYASSCNEKLQWLVDQGFVEVVEATMKMAVGPDGVSFNIKAEWVVDASMFLESGRLRVRLNKFNYSENAGILEITRK